MAVEISDLRADMFVKDEYIQRDTGKWVGLPPAGQDVKQWCESEGYILKPHVNQREFEAKFISDIIPLIKALDQLHNYEQYLREHFVTGETPYDIDFEHEDFIYEFHDLLYEFYELFDEYYKYTKEEFTKIAVK